MTKQSGPARLRTWRLLLGGLACLSCSTALAQTDDAVSPDVAPSAEQISVTAAAEQLAFDPVAEQRPVQETNQDQFPAEASQENAIPQVPESAPKADPYATLKRSVELQEYEPSLRQAEEIIAAIELDSDRYDPKLAEPLLIRGDAKFGLGDFPGALDDYARSVHVSRVNSGLHHPDQIPAVYREANTLKHIGKLQAASGREEYAYEVLRNHYGAYSPKILPGLYHLAEWHTRTNNPFAARRLFAQAKLIIESSEDEMSANLIKPLRGLALTHRMERFPPYYASRRSDPVSTTVNGAPELYRGGQPITLNNFPAGEKALKRIVRIREVTGETEPVAWAEAIIDLADWNLLFEKYKTAEQFYQHAELLLAKAHEGAAKSAFAKPELLHFPEPSNPKAPPEARRGEPQTGHVTLSYSVTARGTVANLETLDSQPEGLMDFRVRKSMRAARFRPPMVDGQLIAATDQTFRHEYRYYPTDRSETTTEDTDLVPGQQDTNQPASAQSDDTAPGNSADTAVEG